MTPFEASVVASTAITDLINAGVLLIAFLLLRNFLPKECATNRYWKRLMIMAAVSCFLGWATHIYYWGFGMIFLLWLVLSITILETAHSFLMIGVCTISNGTRPNRRELRYLRLGELAALIFLIAAMLFRWHPIQPLVAFAILLVIPGLYLFFRMAVLKHSGSRILLCFIIPLIPCLVLQLLGLHEETVIGNLNVDGLCHIFILIDIPVVYAAARKWES